MKIEKTTSFSADLKVDEEAPAYVTFSGSVGADGKPNINFYISDMAIYMAHTTEFMSAFTQFQKAVFDYSNEMLKGVTDNKEA
ncbi:hypothetical protein [Weissella minor]|uniref:hypothetical protein n=1 Tax=Weissella minor TaxID=1620 RepID=UPI003AF2B320